MQVHDALTRSVVLIQLVLTLLCLSLAPARACSTLAFPGQDGPLLAFNFDFDKTDAGFLARNPKGIARQSVMNGKPASWTARFGSFTVNQIGPGMPTAGMNTAGLVITLMWNESAVYGGHSDAPTVSELEFIQFLLDTSGTVDEALARRDRVRIKGLVPIHYFLFDRTGAAAVLTPTRTGLQVHAGDSLPVAALTNTSYAAALAHLGRFRGFGGKTPVPQEQRSGKQNSLDRFAIAASLTGLAGTGHDSRHAFAALERLANPDTRWQLVFSPQDRRMRLRLGNFSKELVLDLTTQDFACEGPPVGVNLRRLTSDSLAEMLQPLDRQELAANVAEVLSSLSRTAHLGRPETAAGLAAGLIAAGGCTLD